MPADRRQAEQSRAERNMRLVNPGSGGASRRPVRVAERRHGVSVCAERPAPGNRIPAPQRRRSPGAARLRSSMPTSTLGRPWAPAAIGNPRGKHTGRPWNCFPTTRCSSCGWARSASTSGRLEEAAACYQTVLQRGRLRSSVIHVSNGHAHAALRLGEIYARWVSARVRSDCGAITLSSILKQRRYAKRSKNRTSLPVPSSWGLGSDARPPDFLFVITAYNASPFLGPLVASLASQRWTAWKAIFVDDCSTDGTLDSLRTLLNTHALSDKFRIVENRERRFQVYNVYHALQNNGQPRRRRGHARCRRSSRDG